jgi:hypothetical protein
VLMAIMERMAPKIIKLIDFFMLFPPFLDYI